MVFETLGMNINYHDFCNFYHFILLYNNDVNIVHKYTNICEQLDKIATARHAMQIAENKTVI